VNDVDSHSPYDQLGTFAGFPVSAVYFFRISLGLGPYMRYHLSLSLQSAETHIDQENTVPLPLDAGLQTACSFATDLQISWLRMIDENTVSSG
jgi:hypothetical protein